MATTLLNERISSFIEDKFPEFVKSDHPVFVEFLKLYYQFMEAAKITLTNVKAYDTVLLENLLTENFLLLEDGTKVVGEDSTYGAFLKDETVTGQTSTAFLRFSNSMNSVSNCLRSGFAPPLSFLR